MVQLSTKNSFTIALFNINPMDLKSLPVKYHHSHLSRCTKQTAISVTKKETNFCSLHNFFLFFLFRFVAVDFNFTFKNVILNRLILGSQSKAKKKKSHKTYSFQTRNVSRAHFFNFSIRTSYFIGQLFTTLKHCQKTISLINKKK